MPSKQVSECAPMKTKIGNVVVKRSLNRSIRKVKIDKFKLKEKGRFPFDTKYVIRKITYNAVYLEDIKIGLKYEKLIKQYSSKIHPSSLPLKKESSPPPLEKQPSSHPLKIQPSLISFEQKHL